MPAILALTPTQVNATGYSGKFMRRRRAGTQTANAIRRRFLVRLRARESTEGSRKLGRGSDAPGKSGRVEKARWRSYSSNFLAPSK
jgi:hypothetical protein